MGQAQPKQTPSGINQVKTSSHEANAPPAAHKTCASCTAINANENPRLTLLIRQPK